VRASKCGTRVTYDYGEYKVELKSKRDYVEVEYHD
jgi:DNA-directed RNA polymerase subunit N (RpoN/RPB10)